MHYSLKYISILTCGFVVGYLVHKPSIQLQPATEVYKEVAHLPPTSFSNGVLIYTDTANDTAYYVATDRLQNVEPKDVVTLDTGESTTVQQVDLRGFYLDATQATVRAGMSGTPVWHDNEIIGYVSSLRNSNTLYCIWAN